MEVVIAVTHYNDCSTFIVIQDYILVSKRYWWMAYHAIYCVFTW